MRTATIVLVAYVFCVVTAAFWRVLPGPLHDALPDLGAVTAAYLGLTTRRTLAPAVGGSIALGYLVDLICGAPPGLIALVLGLTGLVARAVQRRIYVRGATMTIAFSGFISLVSSLLAMLVRALYRMPRAAWSIELRHLALVAIATAIIGPLVWRVFRRIDAAYARTHRDREAALEGIR
jgi:cell shape-determining protein MreD